MGDIDNRTGVLRRLGAQLLHCSARYWIGVLCRECLFRGQLLTTAAISCAEVTHIARILVSRNSSLVGQGFGQIMYDYFSNSLSRSPASYFQMR